MPRTNRHVVLLGDSIFDNAVYTGGEPDVAAHLRQVLPTDWQVSLFAQDGATVAALDRQLARVPDDGTHLIISVGGNDALHSSDLLALRASSSIAVLEAFAARTSAFQRAYRAAISHALTLGRFTAVCTVYNGALDRDQATAARVGIAIFNDVILRTAVDLRVDALELRSICTDPSDYANPIEPSGTGGHKIARGIAHLIGALPDASRPAQGGGTDVDHRRPFPATSPASLREPPR